MRIDDIFRDAALPPPPARVFLLGIGGSGMSPLAQLLAHCGYRVAGSDRGIGDAGRAELFRQLRGMGIGVQAQDGVGVAAFRPDAAVCSAAIEPGNADLLALPPGCPVIHRARALSRLLGGLGAPLVTVAGSCGKTSVCGWLASALKALGRRVLMVNGGQTLDFAAPGVPGNFHGDRDPEYLVAEVDESDRSIREFAPDYGILLNVGNDHFGRRELEGIFADHLRRCVRGAVLPESLRHLAPETVRTALFADRRTGGASSVPYPAAYRCLRGGIRFSIGEGGPVVRCRQSGFHSALNGLAVFRMLEMLLPGEDPRTLAGALAAYRGAKQRFELMSREGAFPVIDDYAHNPEKIAAALRTARERFPGRVLAVFQPHGYGPWGFMREALRSGLGACLRPEDLLLVLPVYYAGGTSSFRPDSREVAEELAAAGLPVRAVEGRAEAERILLAGPGGGDSWSCVLVMGARDASLRTWSAGLAELTSGNPGAARTAETR